MKPPLSAGRAVRGALLGATLFCGLSACSTLPGWMLLQGQSAITDYRHFDNAPIARGASPSSLQAAPAPLQWPGGLTTDAAESLLASNGTVAFVVIRRGVVVYERYFNGYARDSVTTSFSMAKSVVSALVGIAIAEGRIGSVDDPVTRYLPELRGNDPRFDRVTLRHLLAMRSGIAFEEAYRTPLSEAARFYLGPDLRAEVARLRTAGEPDQATSTRAATRSCSRWPSSAPPACRSHATSRRGCGSRWARSSTPAGASTAKPTVSRVRSAV